MSSCYRTEMRVNSRVVTLRFLVARYEKLESSWEVNSLEVLLGLFSFCFS